MQKCSVKRIFESHLNELLTFLLKEEDFSVPIVNALISIANTDRKAAVTEFHKWQKQLSDSKELPIERFSLIQDTVLTAINRRYPGLITLLEQPVAGYAASIDINRLMELFNSETRIDRVLQLKILEFIDAQLRQVTYERYIKLFGHVFPYERKTGRGEPVVTEKNEKDEGTFEADAAALVSNYEQRRESHLNFQDWFLLQLNQMAEKVLFDAPLLETELFMVRELDNYFQDPSLEEGRRILAGLNEFAKGLEKVFLLTEDLREIQTPVAQLLYKMSAEYPEATDMFNTIQQALLDQLPSIPPNLPLREQGPYVNQLNQTIKTTMISFTRTNLGLQTLADVEFGSVRGQVTRIESELTYLKGILDHITTATKQSYYVKVYAEANHRIQQNRQIKK